MTIVWFWQFFTLCKFTFYLFLEILSLSLFVFLSLLCDDDLFKKMTSSNEMCILYGFGKSHSMQVYNGLQLFGKSLLSLSISLCLSLVMMMMC